MRIQPGWRLRAFLVWLLIIGVETLHGILRQLTLAPWLGDRTARRVAVLTGSALILTIAVLTSRWLDARDPTRRWTIGAGWVILTVGFEVGLGWLIAGPDLTARLAEDYDLRRGGLLGLGMVVLLAAPSLAWRWRNPGSTPPPPPESIPATTPPLT